MEPYDFLGRWRGRYAKIPLNATGNMPVEQPSTVPSAFVTISKRPAQFTRCLTEKLWVYAMGRRISFTDRDDIDRIVAELPKHGYGLQELIHQIVARPFHSK